LIIFFLNNNEEPKKIDKYNISWFDICEDWDLIVVSIAQQYNIFIDEMSEEDGNDIYFKTFLRLISGLKPETALGYVVSIRSEEDYQIRKKFTEDEKRIWISWQKRIPVEYKQAKLQEKLNKLG
jgi:hypothetical protein